MAKTDWHSLIWIDGKQSECLPVTDRATQYGDGLFETIRWQHDKLLMLDAHLQRLMHGCQRLQIPLDFTCLDKLLEQPNAVLRQLEKPSAILKLIVTRGPGGRGYSPPEPVSPRIIVQLHPFPNDPTDRNRHGIAAMQSTIPVTENTCLAGMKHLNRLDSVLASQELAVARSRPGLSELNETLLCNARGEFIEGSRSNLFVVLGDRLITPILSASGVAGVLREALLSLGQDIGLTCVTEAVTIDTMRAASELFICNSVIGIQPIHSLYLENEVNAQQPRPLVFTDRSVTTRCQNLIGERFGIYS